MGQNWDLLNGTITDKYNASLTSYQNGIRVNPFTYTGTVKVTFDLVVTSGSCKFVAGGSNEQIYSTSGTKEIIVTNPSRFEFNAFNLGWVGTLDNVSAIQITDDTNLPRINYEGFSYQDALGSELITNGGFEDGLTDWTAYAGTISIETNIVHSGTQSAKVDGVGIQQSRSYTDGEQVYYNFWVYSTTGTSVFIQTINENVTIPLNQWVQVSGIGTINGNNSSFRIRIANGLWYIDSVSVKEYLGQEVVPDSGCGSWLWESQSTNVITQSETFSDASWVNNGVTITSNEITSPSGTLNADLLTGVSGGFGVVKFSTWTATNKVASCFAKKGSTNLFKIANVSGGIGGVTFNLENGTVTNEDSGFESNIENYGNGWYRCTAIDTLGRTGTFSLGVTAASESVYIWGAMLEQGNISSYIPTEGSTVTRNQDLCTNGGSLASINSTEGTLYFEGSALANDSIKKGISLSDGTTANRIILRYGNQSNKLEYIVVGGGGIQANMNTSSFNILNNLKIAIKWKLNDFALWVNGVEVGTDTSGNTFLADTLNQLNFDTTALEYFYGKTKALAVWKEALSDAELTELTTI